MRVAWVAIVIATFVALAAPGCNGPERKCSGTRGRSCHFLPASQCPTVSDCHRVAPRCLSHCEKDEPGEACSVIDCAYDPVQCRSRCEFADTAEECAALMLSCLWEGDACVPGCAALDTPDACADGPFCFWLECDGQSKDCDKYESEDCPVVLGCDNEAERKYF